MNSKGASSLREDRATHERSQSPLSPPAVGVPLRGADGFDCFRRGYVGEALIQAADVMSVRKRREFARFIRSLPTGGVQ